MRALPLLLLAACSGSGPMGPAEPSDPPGPGEARVIVQRPVDRSPLRTWSVWDRLELAGFLDSGSTIEFLCAPGEHLFLIVGSTDGAIRADLAAGKTYLLKAVAEPAFFRLQLKLEPIEGEPEIERRLERNPERSEAFIAKHWDRISERIAWYDGEGRAECAELKKELGR